MAKTTYNIDLALKVTPRQIRAAFTKWEKRYRDHPEEFETEVHRLLHSTPKTYGTAAGTYFVFLLGLEKTMSAVVTPSRKKRT